MKIRAILSAIVVIVALIICYWKFDDKIVTTSVIAATTFLNLVNNAKGKKTRNYKFNCEDLKSEILKNALWLYMPVHYTLYFMLSIYFYRANRKGL